MLVNIWKNSPIRKKVFISIDIIKKFNPMSVLRGPILHVLMCPRMDQPAVCVLEWEENEVFFLNLKITPYQGHLRPKIMDFSQKN